MAGNALRHFLLGEAEGKTAFPEDEAHPAAHVRLLLLGHGGD